MISLHRLNGTQFWLNAELIEQIDSTPDTVITLTTGNNMIVTESGSQVVKKIKQYRAEIGAAVSDVKDRPVAGFRA